MNAFTIVYEGDLSTEAIYPETGHVLMTDAPKDNQGQGRTFSPTDLMAVSLGSCVLTLMGIAARRLKIDVQGMALTISKKMSADLPRRIVEMEAHIYVPQLFSEEIQGELERAGKNCPVHYSLHPDIVQQFHFHWGESLP